MMRPFVLACLTVLPFLADGAAAEEAAAAQCALDQNDDTVRPYDPSLRAGLLKAYADLFPAAHMPPDERVVQAGTHIRCMDGRLLACFTGANLPCDKMNTARVNEGAEAFCRTNPNALVVPAFATGHDTTYVYRCVAQQAEITGEAFSLDRRGFAAKLWTPIKTEHSQ